MKPIQSPPPSHRRPLDLAQGGEMPRDEVAERLQRHEGQQRAAREHAAPTPTTMLSRHSSVPATGTTRGPLAPPLHRKPCMSGGSATPSGHLVRTRRGHPPMSMLVAVMLPSLLCVPVTRICTPALTALALAAWPFCL